MTMQVWISEESPTRCAVCAALDGTRVPVGADFPYGPPPIHPGCKCRIEIEADSPYASYELTTTSNDPEYEQYSVTRHDSRDAADRERAAFDAMRRHSANAWRGRRARHTRHP
jgi:hypothetical protein